MTDLFLKILNMSISASWLVLAVFVLRLIFKKAPRWVSVLLWGIVAVRLVCPFSPESVLSLIPSGETISPEIMMDPSPTIHSGIAALNSAVNPVISQSLAPAPGDSANPLQIWIPVVSAVWGIGVILMLCYTAVSYGQLRRKVRAAVYLRDNIYRSENVAAPFVLGVINPAIYLPLQMAEKDCGHVIAHEQAHIRRKDHWWKPFGFLLLTIHWFNPLMWLAYGLLCRDIELACDEKVVKDLEDMQRADYSQALLDVSVNRRMIAACPLAFGGVGVKMRVKKVLHYKRPALWIVIAAVIICTAVAVCFLTNPVEEPERFAAGEVREWVNYYESMGDMDWAQELEISLAEFPNVTFRYTPGQVVVGNDVAQTTLIQGMPIWNVFFADLSGDGVPEICATVSFGSGIIDTHVVVVDHMSGTDPEYTLWERGKYDYSLRLENGKLICDKREYPDGEIVASGELQLAETGEGERRLEIAEMGRNNGGVASDAAAGRSNGGAASADVVLNDAVSAATATVGMIPGTTYVPYQCLYMSPASSYAAIGGDSGYKYVIGENDFTITNRNPVIISSATTYPGQETVTFGNSASIPVEKWEWQEFPYTDEEWADLYEIKEFGAILNISEVYEEILYQPLDEECFLLSVDGTIWLVELKNKLWRIYSLVPENFMGTAQWEHAPALSSRSPFFQFTFDLECTAVSALCTEGLLVDYDGENVTSGKDLTFESGNALRWSPMDEQGNVASGTKIVFFVQEKDSAISTCVGSIYITMEKKTAHGWLYEAGLVGTGLHLKQNTEWGGGIITISQ